MEVPSAADRSHGVDVDKRPAPPRVHWLDGVRGLAALFVVVHHMWLRVWPGFPRNDGPWWVGPLLYGHLAVAVFIVVSGFSLALAPMGNDMELRGGTRTFIRRRAWRILPAYWAALVFATVISFGVLSHLPAPTVAKGFVVHGLLLQDAIGSVTPNGAFWSIAVEWQIYFVFPLILLLARRISLEAAVAATAAVVLGAHFLARTGAPFDKLDHLTPQFLALFAFGVLAMGAARRGQWVRRGFAAVAIATIGAVVLGAAVQGSTWLVPRYFWVDLVFGTGIACVLGVMYMGGAQWLRGALTSRVCLRLGLFSYSLYLVHAPLIGLIHKYAIAPYDLSALEQFAVLIAVGLPLILLFAYGFHLLFEAPFLRSRSWSALGEHPLVRTLKLPVRRPRAEDARRVVTPSQDHHALSGPEPNPSTAPSGGA
jgi:peptidoglycan/LPS O-acetylase OafA/YrhL